nr:cytochrome c biogenesis protein ccs1 [Pedinophyceae sp. YPF-701]
MIKSILNMDTLETTLQNTSFAFLFGNMLLYWLNLTFSIFKDFQKKLTITNSITLLCLSFLLISRWILSGHFPLSNLYESLIFLTWAVQILLAISQTKAKNLLFGVILSPVTLFTYTFAAFVLPSSMQAPSPLVPSLQSNWLMMHVTIMLLSYAALITGSLLAISFLILEKVFFNNKEDIILSEDKEQVEKMESKQKVLNTLDNFSYRVLGFGFPLLTLGILSGAVWANETWGSYWNWDPKETWALITWLVFAIYLHSRLIKKWEGTKPALIASAGFVVVWVCYLGVNLIGKGLHSYGWWA